MTGTSTVRVIGGRNQDGFTLIDMLFVVALIGLLSTLAIPGLMRAKDAARSASALGTLRLVNGAQLSYAISCGLGFYSPDMTTLTVRPLNSSEPFLSGDLATGNTFIKSGYNFSLAGTPLPGAPATCNGLPAGASAPGYAMIADQLGALPGNGRFFGTNADGIIYEHNSSLGATMPEAGGPPQGAPIK